MLPKITGNHHPLQWFLRFLSTASFFFTLLNVISTGAFILINYRMFYVFLCTQLPVLHAMPSASLLYFSEGGEPHSSAVDGATASGNGRIDLNGGAAAGCHGDRADGVCSHLGVPAEDLHSSVRSLLRQRLHGGVVELHPRQLVSVPTQEHLLKPRTFNLHLQLLDFTFI